VLHCGLRELSARREANEPTRDEIIPDASGHEENEVEEETVIFRTFCLLLLVGTTRMMPEFELVFANLRAAP